MSNSRQLFSLYILFSLNSNIVHTFKGTKRFSFLKFFIYLEIIENKKSFLITVMCVNGTDRKQTPPG